MNFNLLSLSDVILNYVSIFVNILFVSWFNFFFNRFYVGVESLAFSADTVENPKKNLPIGSVSCILTLAATSILVLFIVCSSDPGVQTLSGVLAVFDTGFSHLFGLSSHYVIILSVPATYATAFGFIYPYGKLLEAMSNSKLLPTPLSWKTNLEYVGKEKKEDCDQVCE